MLSLVLALDKNYKQASLNTINKLKTCLKLEQVFAEDYSYDDQITDPLGFLDKIKPDLLEAISQSNNPKIKQVEESFDTGFKTFKKEVLNTVENDRLCIEFRTKLNEKIKALNYSSFYDFILKDGFSRLNDKEDDHIAFLEQWASVGHPVHPSYKNKPDMSKEDVLKYCPEFHPVVSLKLVALKNEVFNSEMPNSELNYQDWFADKYPDSFKSANNELNKMGLDYQDFSYIPVHPWQAEHILPKWFSHLFENQSLILLKESFIASSSSVSFRSMMPFGKTSPNIKLPASLQMTSVVRYISPAKLYNSVYLSKLIKNILSQENNFDNSLDFLSESVCATIKVSEKNKISEISTRHLSAIYREKPLSHLEEGEIGIPLTALLLDSPISQKPLLIETIEDNNLIDKSSLESSIRKYFSDYAKTSIRGPLGIYLKYGVNVECHQQNTIQVFKSGVLQRSLVRDTAGVDIHKPSFDRTSMSLKLHPKTNQYFSDRGLRVHLIHCLFKSHLAEIIKILSEAYNIDDSLLWSDLQALVKKELELYQKFMPLDEWQVEYNAILKDPWPYKALMLMRIADTKEIFIDSTNPFITVDSLSLST